MDPETNNTSDQEDDTEVFAVNLEPIVEIDENVDLGKDGLFSYAFSNLTGRSTDKILQNRA